MNQPMIGTAIIERSLLRALEHLWEGPLHPSELPSVEKAVRAFLMAPVLTVSRYCGLWDNPEHPSKARVYYDDPFHDHLLDYEFTHPREAHPFTDLDPSESSFLLNLIQSNLESKFFSVLPSWIKTQGQAHTYMDAWYEGQSTVECELAARIPGPLHSDDNQPFDRNIHTHALFHRGPQFHAEYLVGCHRAGLIVYGASPIAELCSEHLFSKWPDHLLKNLDEEYAQAAEELRGPGLGINLPPLTSLVLSRAPSRAKIPGVLRDLRDEYKDGRDQLWEILGEMWNAETFKRQIGILRDLEAAAAALFKTAFPETVDALSIALTVTRLIKGDAVGPLEKLHTWNKPRAKVGAVSFAAKLATDLRSHLLSQRQIIRRHLSPPELREFGIEP